MKNSNTNLACVCISEIGVLYITETNGKKLAQVMLNLPDEEIA